jgi:hypothetical protein
MDPARHHVFEGGKPVWTVTGISILEALAIRPWGRKPATS